MSRRILPCPFCGASHHTLQREQGLTHMPKVQVRCCGCGARGPLDFDVDRAVDAWNAVPRTRGLSDE